MRPGPELRVANLLVQMYQRTKHAHGVGRRLADAVEIRARRSREVTPVAVPVLIARPGPRIHDGHVAPPRVGGGGGSVLGGSVGHGTVRVGHGIVRVGRVSFVRVRAFRRVRRLGRVRAEERFDEGSNPRRSVRESTYEFSVRALLVRAIRVLRRGASFREEKVEALPPRDPISTKAKMSAPSLTSG